MLFHHQKNKKYRSNYFNSVSPETEKPPKKKRKFFQKQ